MRVRFHQSLDELKEKLLVMAGMAEQAIQRATEAYRLRDSSYVTLVRQSEPALRQMQSDIDQIAFDLLAMEQPMAVDLRLIVSMIRINADLRRVGDLAINIAVRAEELTDLPPIEIPVDIPKMSALASAMVSKALQAFVDGDTEKAESVLVLDDQVDALNRAAFPALSSLIKHHPVSTHQALHALIITRNLERIGDHATNIAEDVIFWVRGNDVRHHHDLTV